MLSRRMDQQQKGEHQRIKYITAIGGKIRYNSKELPLKVDVSTRYLMTLKGKQEAAITLISVYGNSSNKLQANKNLMQYD